MHTFGSIHVGFYVHLFLFLVLKDSFFLSFSSGLEVRRESHVLSECLQRTLQSQEEQSGRREGRKFRETVAYSVIMTVWLPLPSAT